MTDINKCIKELVDYAVSHNLAEDCDRAFLTN